MYRPVNFIDRRHALFGLAAMVALIAAAPAGAQSARQLKSTGMVGERLDGYLGIVHGNAGPDVRSAVDQINAQRRQVYEQTARDSGRPLDEVLAVAGARLRDKARPGDWVHNAAGQWIQKR